jgi:hypothetical protein
VSRRVETSRAWGGGGADDSSAAALPHTQKRTDVVEGLGEGRPDVVPVVVVVVVEVVDVDVVEAGAAAAGRGHLGRLLGRLFAVGGLLQAYGDHIGGAPVGREQPIEVVKRGVAAVERDAHHLQEESEAEREKCESTEVAVEAGRGGRRSSNRP